MSALRLRARHERRRERGHELVGERDELARDGAAGERRAALVLDEGEDLIDVELAECGEVRGAVGRARSTIVPGGPDGHYRGNRVSPGNGNRRRRVPPRAGERTGLQTGVRAART
jgi:hypothetical protein